MNKLFIIIIIILLLLFLLPSGSFIMNIHLAVSVSVERCCSQTAWLCQPALLNPLLHFVKGDVLVPRALRIPSAYQFCHQCVQLPTRRSGVSEGLDWLEGRLHNLHELFTGLTGICKPFCQGPESGFFGFPITWSPLLELCSPAAMCRILEFLVSGLCARTVCKVVATRVGVGVGKLPLLQVLIRCIFKKDLFTYYI